MNLAKFTLLLCLILANLFKTLGSSANSFNFSNSYSGFFFFFLPIKSLIKLASSGFDYINHLRFVTPFFFLLNLFGKYL